MIEQWDKLAMKALAGQNSQPTTWDIWKHNAKSTADMFQNSQVKVIDGVVYRTCKFPVTAPR